MKTPYIVKLASTLTVLFIITLAIIYGQGLIIPIYLAGLFAVLLRRIVIFFESKLRFPKILAILTTEVIVFLLLFIVFGSIFYEAKGLVSDWATIQSNMLHHVKLFQLWLNEKIGISITQQSDFMSRTAESLIDKSGDLIAGTLESIGNILFNIILIPIYIFLILLYHNHLTRFFKSLFGYKHLESVNSAISAVKLITENYLIGLLIELIIVAILFATGLGIIGVDYAILLGLIAAMLNVVPYIGSLFAALISIMFTLSTSEDPGKIFGVIAVFIIVKLIDDNILIPKIIGSKVKINALASIIAILTGGAVAGVAGMFLSIPTVAILKVVFDHSEGMEAWGFLLSDDTKAKRNGR